MKVFTQLHHDCHLADSDCKTLLYSMHSDFREVKMYKRYALESIRYGIISIHCKSIVIKQWGNIWQKMKREDKV